MATDYYNILGVERGASKDDIKRAYRKMAHKYHPDKESGDEDKFKQVNEAYQVLGDDAKRSQYDQFGQTFDGAGPGGSNPYGGFNVNFEDLGGFGDIFETFFGGGGARGGAQQHVRHGDNVHIDVTISFKESALGVKQSVKHRLRLACDHCRGNGAEPGTPIETCTTCNGSGTVTTTRQTMLGAFTQRSVCSECAGEGKKPKQACEVCRGDGRQMKDRQLEIDIPAGISDGQQIRITGKGEAAPRGGVAGDLFVTVHVTADKTLRREGNDVHSVVELEFPQAVLGVSTKVETLYGKEELDIPSGTQPGTHFTLRKKGFPDIRSGQQGDHIVTVTVVVPKKVSRKQKKLLEEFQQHEKKGIFS